MDRFVVEGIHGFDGEYPCDIGSFTMRELNIIKRISGIRAGELEESFAAGDTDVILAVAVCAVRRNRSDWEAFEKLAWESELGALTFVVGEDEETEDPQIPTPLPDSSPTDPEPDSSGDGSSSDGDDHQATSLRAIGAQP